MGCYPCRNLRATGETWAAGVVGGVVGYAGNGQQAVVRFVPPLPPKKQQSHPNKQFAKNRAKYQNLYRKCYLGILNYSQVEGVATNTSPFLTHPAFKSLIQAQKLCSALMTAPV